MRVYIQNYKNVMENKDRESGGTQLINRQRELKGKQINQNNKMAMTKNQNHLNLYQPVTRLFKNINGKSVRNK